MSIGYTKGDFTDRPAPDAPLYENVRANVFGHATRPDGYHGATIRIGLSWWRGRVWAIADFGCFPDAPARIESEPRATRDEVIAALTENQSGFYRDFVPVFGPLPAACGPRRHAGALCVVRGGKHRGGT